MKAKTGNFLVIVLAVCLVAGCLGLVGVVFFSRGF